MTLFIIIIGILLCIAVVAISGDKMDEIGED